MPHAPAPADAESGAGGSTGDGARERISLTPSHKHP